MTVTWSSTLVTQQPTEQPSSGPGSGFFLFQLAMIFAIIYFLMIRPKIKQEKKHRERISQLKKGDEIVTAGGIVGEVVHLKDDRVTVRSGESRFVVLRDRVADVPAPKGNDGKSA